MNNINEDIFLVVGFKISLFNLYRKRRELLRRRGTRVGRERGLYCLDGYSSKIFQAVLRKNNNVIKIHLRLTIAGLEEVMHFAEGFLNTQRGWKHFFYVTVFLYWLGCGASYRVTGASFSISRYTVRDIVHKCLKGFLNLMPSVVKYPRLDQYPDIIAKFNRRARTEIFNGALGAIDGSHVRIAVPTRLRDQYMNRKAYTSIQLQAVCSSNMEFFSVCCGYPGSVHDERVLKNSHLLKTPIFPPSGYYLLGDSGYKCRTNPIAILTPYKRVAQLTARQKKFNKLQSKARSVIESAFGMLKTRWRSIFNKVLCLKITRCVEAIAVACIMHNICLNDGFDMGPYETYESPEPINIDELENENPDAIAFRDRIASSIFM